MTADVLQFTKEALWLVLILSAPPVAAATIVGLVVAILQAVTQVQEQTLQFFLKLIVVAVTILATASSIGGALYHFSDRLFVDFPNIVV